MARLVQGSVLRRKAGTHLPPTLRDASNLETPSFVPLVTPFKTPIGTETKTFLVRNILKLNLRIWLALTQKVKMSTA